MNDDFLLSIIRFALLMTRHPTYIFIGTVTGHKNPVTSPRPHAPTTYIVTSTKLYFGMVCGPEELYIVRGRSLFSWASLYVVSITSYVMTPT